jgi:hypothetical protein
VRIRTRSTGPPQEPKLSLNVPKEPEIKDRDKSPNLGEDQMSGCSSSAMCGFEFPENNLG